MQHVVFTIEDQALEKALSDMSTHDSMNLQKCVQQAIQAFVQQRSGNGQKFDPFQHSTPIHYPHAEENNDARPFGWVKDSAQFSKELRANAWKRGRDE